jgi:hypothetical protein
VIFVAPAGRRRYKICLTLDCGKRLFGSPDKTERLIADLHRGSAGFIHLLRGIGIEVSHREAMAYPFRSDILQLRADDRKYRREQNAPVSPDQDEIAYVGDGWSRLRFRRGRRNIHCVASRVRGLLRRSGLLNHHNLRLRLRRLGRLLVLLIGARVIVVVGISTEENRHEGSLPALAIVPEVPKAIGQSAADRR